MPCAFEFDSKNRIIRCRLHGHVSDEDLRTMYAKLYEIVIRTQPNCGIVDGSDATSFEVSPDLMRQLAQATPVMANPALPQVIIAPSP